MASGIPPVSQEQAFLETYFLSLSKCAYDKAKELTDKEKDASKTHPSILWTSCLNQLLSLAMADKAYTSLLYLSHQNLSQRFLGRRDNLKTTYSHMLTEFRRMEESTRRHAETRDLLDTLLGHLSGQLCHFITARLKSMEFYEQVLTMAQSRIVSYEDLLIVISDIIQSHQKNFHHPILSPLKSSFSLECDVMNHLLQGQIHLANCQFLPSLLHLHDAHTKLSSWANMALAKDQGKKLTFGGSSKTTVHNLYQWLWKFKGLLVSKFTLYFYEVLSKQGPSAEVKALTAKASVDFISKISGFQRRSDAACVCLVLELTGMEDTYQGPGYHHPDKGSQRLTGVDSFPAIFTCPAEKPEKLWPSVVMIMTDKADELNNCDKIVYIFDERMQNTFFMVRVEPRITMVVLFENKKSEKDSYINNTVTDICSQLRATRLFAQLRAS